MSRGKLVLRTCHCGTIYRARQADLNRGWGKSCSKHCAAVKRTCRESSGNFKRAKASTKYATRNDPRAIEREKERIWHEANTANEAGWDGHKHRN